MRRFFMGMAIASLTAGAPLTAFGGDREIAEAIITQLKQQQSAGSLKGFDINLSVDDGKVLVEGAVANQSQLDAVLKVASTTAGVKQVINSVTVQEKVAPATPVEQTVQPASANDETPSLLSIPETSESTTVDPRDAGITSEVLSRLGHAQRGGTLRNFDIDVSTVDGEVWVRGHVASPEQKNLVLSTVQRVPGVARVVDEVAIGNTVRPVSNTTASMPVVGGAAPRAFAPSTLVNGSVPGMPVSNVGKDPQYPTAAEWQLLFLCKVAHLTVVLFLATTNQTCLTTHGQAMQHILTTPQ
jgi:osmotically-inducible protein OsmY